MILFECGGPFQKRPSYVRFGDFRRVMWGWFAVTHYSAGGLNIMIKRIADAGVKLHVESEAMIERQFHTLH